MTSFDPNLGKGPHPWRSFAIRAGVFLTFCFGIAYYFSTNPQLLTGEDVFLTVTSERRIAMPAEGEFPYRVTIEMRNPSSEAIELMVRDSCKIFRWVLLSAEGSFIQSKAAGDDCPAPPLAASLAPGAEVKEDFTILLDRRRVAPGPYELRVEYWGRETSQTFTITEPE
ncbi:MAG: hypothetical protein GC199_08180 [Alphaproteobacteria bacterium]|nr:hypothetical protein [Alphaproteobacteria bacterium]